MREAGWLGVAWLIIGGAVLGLFLARLWSSLPPDPEYRRRLAGWLAALAVAAALSAIGALRAVRDRRPMLAPPSLERNGR